MRFGQRRLRPPKWYGYAVHVLRNLRLVQYQTLAVLFTEPFDLIAYITSSQPREVIDPGTGGPFEADPTCKPRVGQAPRELPLFATPSGVPRGGR